MDAFDPDDDDVFEAQRERVERPMARLFREYGRENAEYFGVGLLASIVARVLDLLPPLFLGIAIDAIIRQETAFSLLFVPDAWIPATPREQLWIAAGIVAGSFLFAAAFHWARTIFRIARPSPRGLSFPCNAASHPLQDPSPPTG